MKKARKWAILLSISVIFTMSEITGWADNNINLENEIVNETLQEYDAADSDCDLISEEIRRLPSIEEIKSHLMETSDLTNLDSSKLESDPSHPYLLAIKEQVSSIKNKINMLSAQQYAALDILLIEKLEKVETYISATSQESKSTLNAVQKINEENSFNSIPSHTTTNKLFSISVDFSDKVSVCEIVDNIVIVKNQSNKYGAVRTDGEIVADFIYDSYKFASANQK